MKIGIDVDGVIADNHWAWLGRYNAENGTTWNPDDLTQWEFWKDIGCTPEALFKHWTPDIYRSVRPYPGAVEAIDAIRAAGHELFYITTCSSMAEYKEKAVWLYRHGFVKGGDATCPVGSKAHGFARQTKAEVAEQDGVQWLVDDHVVNCEAWPGYALLLTRPHNRAITTPVKRVRDLGDVALLVETERRFAADIAVNAVYAAATQDKPTNPKDAIGSTKLPLHLWPETATAMGCLAFLEGALKYGRSNFRAIGVRSSIYVDAVKRHVDKWFEGQDIDPESGLPHLSHALACLAILVDAQAAGKLNDDRQYPGGFHKLLEELTPHVARLKDKYADRSPKHYTRADAEAA